ncbi:phosphotransferase family protein [Streptomyces sp. NBC_00154]|uniref:phosphotransferase family protein n=1 Tax=Streptomyces sp. NBC_00154 TaxID=2975670 RepID=UPI0022599D8A|nr:phosphotransferase [Streptomyces sp. NBC_00154]MCX5317011.1 phosphotransferase [Streptomyces sp. NBC_00154]
MLSVETVGDYLRARRLVDGPVRAWTLAGGVSNIVLAVDCAGRRWVVKQSLPQLRVAEEWKAKQQRTLNEGRGLRLVRTITREFVPSVVDIDESEFCIVIDRAPDGWTDWKAALLAGSVDPRVAATLGELLAKWQVELTVPDERLTALDDPEAFDQLRVGPYYRAVAEQLPALADAVNDVVAGMAANKLCLVHGDYSPKNVLVGPSGLWVVDFEVAHLGDPSFDVAFMLTHLLMKSIHLPAHADALRSAASEFHAAYGNHAAPFSADHLAGQLGCLLLARVVGKSPAEYLDQDGRDQVLWLGERLLAERSAALRKVVAA